jgi:hypothetical protein
MADWTSIEKLPVSVLNAKPRMAAKNTINKLFFILSPLNFSLGDNAIL